MGLPTGEQVGDSLRDDLQDPGVAGFDRGPEPPPGRLSSPQDGGEKGERKGGAKHDGLSDRVTGTVPRPPAPEPVTCVSAGAFSAPGTRRRRTTAPPVPRRRSRASRGYAPTRPQSRGRRRAGRRPAAPNR